MNQAVSTRCCKPCKRENRRASAAAHGFKGASANLGFQKLADLAFELEKHEENGRSLREAHTQLLADWEMTHALCLRMGLTDVQNVLDRHRNPPATTDKTPAPA